MAHPRLPLLTTIVALAMVAVGLLFAGLQFAGPTGMMPGTDMTMPAIRGLTFALAARSLAMALALFLAWWFRSPAALIATLAMRAVTEALDLTGMLASGQANVIGIVIVGVMIAAELSAIVQMSRIMRGMQG